LGASFLQRFSGSCSPRPPARDDVALDWSVADRLNGRPGIDLAAPARKAPLRITVGGSCPSQPSFTVDGTRVAVTRAPACSFDLPR
jgi:hypothetical protein